MPDNEFIPASLRIGRIGASAEPRPEVPFDVLLRGINSNYAEWITNSPHWDRNDTRNLIISMKVALERMQQERDEARRLYCQALWLHGGVNPAEQARIKDWDCFSNKTKTEADANNTLFRTTDGE